MDGCSHPEARCGHASTSNDNMMYIHGGMDEGFTAELLSFDMATLTWKEVTPNYRKPRTGGIIGGCLPENYMHLLRDHHSLEYVDGRLIMFGGRGAYTKLSHYTCGDWNGHHCNLRMYIRTGTCHTQE